MTKSNYIQFFKKLTILFIVLVAVDFLSVYVFEYFFNKLPDGRYYKIKYAFEKSDEEIVIVGSSKAESNFVPSIFTDSTNLSCFNAGRGGQSIPYNMAVVEVILKRYTPKYIILNVDPYMLEGEVDYDRLSILHPFYKKHKEIRPILNEKSSFESIKLMSNLYAYNSALFYFFRPFVMPNKDGDPIEKGWKPLFRDLSPIEAIRLAQTDSTLKESGNKPLNDKRKEMFLTIVNRCNEKQTQLVLVVCPEFTDRNYETASLNFISNYAKQHGLIYWDFSRDKNFVNNINFFADELHLNNIGAKHFSSLLSTELKNMDVDKDSSFYSNLLQK